MKDPKLVSGFPHCCTRVFPVASDIDAQLATAIVASFSYVPKALFMLKYSFTNITRRERGNKYIVERSLINFAFGNGVADAILESRREL